MRLLKSANIWQNHSAVINFNKILYSCEFLPLTTNDLQYYVLYRLRYKYLSLFEFCRNQERFSLFKYNVSCIYSDNSTISLRQHRPTKRTRFLFSQKYMFYTSQKYMFYTFDINMTNKANHGSSVTALLSEICSDSNHYSLGRIFFPPT